MTQSVYIEAAAKHVLVELQAEFSPETMRRLIQVGLIYHCNHDYHGGGGAYYHLRPKITQEKVHKEIESYAKSVNELHLHAVAASS